jgi:hypothetical protein
MSPSPDTRTGGLFAPELPDLGGSMFAISPPSPISHHQRSSERFHIVPHHLDVRRRSTIRIG